MELLSRHPLSESHEPSEEARKVAHISSMAQYEAMYKESIEDPTTFWGKIAKTFYWHKEAPEGTPLCR